MPAFANQSNRSFADTVLVTSPLDDGVEWIADNLSPEDVFSEDVLEKWALDSGFIYDED